MKETPARWKGLWEKFLKFSPGCAEVISSSEILREGVKDPLSLLQDKAKGKYRIEWKERISEADSPTRRLEALREWQREELVRLAWRNFAQPIPAGEAARAWTTLGEFTVQTELALAKEKAPDLDQGETEGFAILALGKLGAGDLNFYSDLDLIFVYGEDEKESAATRLARTVVGDLDAPGGERIYRIDLRLRPEGDRGPLVFTPDALAEYYEAYGEVWERCAWIRGRGVAGDEENAYELLQALQPFIFPRGLSPSALGELFQQKSRAEDELVADEDREREIKRGRGGLREVEFPVLGLQLLHGASQPTLQTHDLRKAIRNLEILGIIKQGEAEILRGGYDFWRRLEDFLQMRQLRQTHLLPENPEDMDLLAQALGQGTGKELEKMVEGWRGRVRHVYDSILGDLKPKTVAGVDWPGGVDWADAKAARLAWESLEPGEEVHASGRTKENFQRWLPLLEKEMRRCVRPDPALTGLANFVQAYGARSLLYESLCASPKALELLVRFFESSESLGRALVARPELFEAVTQSELDTPRTVEFHRQALVLPPQEEEAMDAARLYVRGEELRIAIRSLLGLGEIEDFQKELTALAEVCLDWAWNFAGRPSWAWIGLGKLGGSALSFGSDLDLLVVGEGEASVQKAVKFLTAETASGRLFQVDFRLRPYAEGVLGVPLDRYVEYYGNEAQGWEVQALTRARFLGGSEKVGQQFWPAVEKSWLRWGKEKGFFKEIVAMRERIATERVAQGAEERSYKTARGGLLDVEFAAQAWQMREGFRESRTGLVLQTMSKTLPREAGVLTDGLNFWSRVEWWIRLGEGRSSSLLPKEGRDLEWLAARCGEVGGKDLMRRVRETFKHVHAAYEKVVR
ncbi:MAG: hypothetical protein EBS69_05850 [Verrucomicrobia bacterium]|nr:hypothetical protein [Verrucomicrobiota bacterium]